MIPRKNQLTDEMLAHVPSEYEKARLASLSDPSKYEDHQFSERFYQKMRLLYEKMGWKYNPGLMEK